MLMDLFDAVVPLLASAASIMTSAANIPDALSFNAVDGTGSKSHVPYCMLLAGSAGWVCYGWLQGVAAVLLTNSVGLFISLFLAFAFLRHTHSPALPQRHYALVALYASSLFLYGFVVGPSAASHVGSVASLVTILMFASPLANLRLVLETKSTESLPVGMVIMGVACTFLWTAYGIRLGDLYVYGPNSIALAVGLVQIAVLLKYENKKRILPGGE